MEHDPYFEVIRNGAIPVPMPDHMKVNFQPIAEYDRVSNVMFRTVVDGEKIEAFGCWREDFGAYCEFFGCEVVPLTFEPESFSYLSDELAFALAVI